MVNYSNSTIYKIVCNNTDIKELYIGSTTNFSRRKCCHKSNCNNEKSKDYNIRLYQFIRANGGWENFDMVQIENYNAKDKRDLHSRERHWIEQLKASLNYSIPNTEHKESAKKYYAKNRKKISDLCKIYCEKNKEKISNRHKEYYKNTKEMRTCVCGLKYNYGYSSDRNKHYRTKKHTEYIQNFYEQLQELMSQ